MRATLITGATGGLGRAFCFALAKETLLLTGRSEEKLICLREELLQNNPNATVFFYACRLDREEERARFYDFIERESFTFSKLVLVAGADIQKELSAYTEEKLLFQTRINFEANASLLRFCFARREADFSVLGISSVSGIYPMPYFALYSATKSAFTSLLEALSVEWKGKARVTAVLPGAMPTREDVQENIKTQGLWGKLAVKSPEWVASASLKALKRGKRKYIPGFWNNVMNAFTKLIPMSFKLKFIARRWSKTTKDAF